MMTACKTIQTTEPRDVKVISSVPCANLKEVTYSYSNRIKETQDNKLDTRLTVNQIVRQNAVIGRGCKEWKRSRIGGTHSSNGSSLSESLE